MPFLHVGNLSFPSLAIHYAEFMMVCHATFIPPCINPRFLDTLLFSKSRSISLFDSQFLVKPESSFTLLIFTLFDTSLFQRIHACKPSPTQTRTHTRTRARAHTRCMNKPSPNPCFRKLTEAPVPAWGRLGSNPGFMSATYSVFANAITVLLRISIRNFCGDSKNANVELGAWSPTKVTAVADLREVNYLQETCISSGLEGREGEEGKRRGEREGEGKRRRAREGEGKRREGGEREGEEGGGRGRRNSV